MDSMLIVNEKGDLIGERKYPKTDSEIRDKTLKLGQQI